MYTYSNNVCVGALRLILRNFYLIYAMTFVYIWLSEGGGGGRRGGGKEVKGVECPTFPLSGETLYVYVYMCGVFVCMCMCDWGGGRGDVSHMSRFAVTIPRNPTGPILLYTYSRRQKNLSV